MKKINLSDIVKFKVTSHSRKILELMDKGFPIKCSYIKNIDSEGFIELPLWEIMHLFGNEIHLKNQVFENNLIYIKD